MAASPEATARIPGTSPHLASRIEDWFHDVREKSARRRGHTATIIPYTGYGSPGWVRVLCRVLLSKPGTGTRYKKIRGWRSFTSVPLNDASVIITVNGIEHRVTADRGGVVDTVIDCSLTPGWHSIGIRTEDSEEVEAPVFVVDPAARFGLVSDVDDTVMVTALPRPLLAAWNTFVLDEHARRPVPGMAVLYERLLQDHPGAPCFYLSTGAWNVAPTLNRFLRRHLYPSGPLLLTDWGPTHDRWFRSGRAHKEETLRRLDAEFPDLRWLLVGDDGQHDEEIYSAFAEEHPGRVQAVAIRQLSTGEAVLAGGRKSDEERSAATAVPWYYAPTGAGLAEQLLGDTRR
ncbi:phosphatidate phosphatase APP1 [Homoserinimonas aerilata]|uniref:Phosphatidate phosphatase APP1 n=1 Tax=Homoserinimonas aerilata TaxID=1162970 RepID=A0A542YI99_9MICO|nr:phosphatase domain-containing protein [Homoserinimonas aerilata]TQL47815.1 phosphatidate phosphatase APP1 [Homoserinimonas aerilata]